MSDKIERLVFDYDNIIYKVGFVTEDRWIDVLHRETGRTKRFKNKTEFYGRKKNVIEGWLGELNAERALDNKRPFTREEFDITPVRTPGELSHVLATAKAMINNIVRDLNADEYCGFVGKGESFRLERSTLMKYKGDRDPSERPILKDEITEYILKNHNADAVTKLEADDWCIIEGMKPGRVVVAIDKDTYGFPVQVYNPDKPEMGIVKCDNFGELRVVEGGSGKNKTKDVKGHGRKWFYFQVAYGDDVDCYRSNAASDKEFGVMSAFDMLNPATNDVEALRALVKIYKHLYPEPVEFKSWRGDDIVVDWRYALSEIWDMARMWRSEDDDVPAEKVFRKFDLWED